MKAAAFFTLIVLGTFVDAASAQAVARTNIDMMPNRIEQPQRQKLYRAFYANQGQINRANQRIRKIDGALKKKPAGPEAQKLKSERARLRKRVPQLQGAMLKGFADAGLNAADIARLRRMPLGDLREERYNHSLVLETPTLTDAQRTLVAQCVAAIDAAQRALLFQQRALQRAVKEIKELDPTIRRQLGNSVNTQRQQMERRFWKMMYYALTPDQMVELRKNVSPRYGYIPQLEQHMYLLPEMSASQATRVRALFREHESETAADVAEQRRLGQALRNKQLKKPERDALKKQAQTCNGRLYRIRKAFRESLKSSVNETQLHALKSIPPMVYTGDLNQGLRPAIAQMAPTPKQNRTLAAIRKEIEQKQRAIRRKRAKEIGDMRGANLGPESPQQMSMQMMQRRSQSEGLALVRAAGLNVLTEVLTPGQISNWIVAPVTQP